MSILRVVISLFLVVLIALSIAGWVWSGVNQPPGPAVAARLVLAIGAFTGVVGLVMLWRVRLA